MSDLYKNLPKTVKVGCFTYSVVVMSAHDQIGDGIYGDMNAVLQRIRLAPNMSAQRLANTFIHEVLHAIHDYLDVSDTSTEEETTTLGANGLCAFWQENPEVCRWWVKLNSMRHE